MHRTGHRKLAKLVALTTIVAMLLVAPASAQIWGRVWLQCANGEPTDPDGACLLLQSAEVDLEDYGMSPTVPQDEAEAQSWLEALVNLLREVGLLAPKDAG
jgi:hypothetical protein